MSQEKDSAQNIDEPLNEVEEQLFALFDDRVSREDFLRVFLTSQLYILVDGEPVGNTLGDKHPMVISTSPEAPKLMAVFSNPQRAGKMQELFPDYTFPILVDCDWVFRTIGPHMGVALNPGWHLGFEIAPEGAQQIKEGIMQSRARLAEER